MPTNAGRSLLLETDATGDYFGFFEWQLPGLRDRLDFVAWKRVRQDLLGRRKGQGRERYPCSRRALMLKECWTTREDNGPSRAHAKIPQRTRAGCILCQYGVFAARRGVTGGFLSRSLDRPARHMSCGLPARQSVNWDFRPGGARAVARGGALVRPNGYSPKASQRRAHAAA